MLKSFSKDNISLLREKCQKNKLKSNTGLTLLNRRVSIYITWLFLRLQLKPAQTSILSILWGIIGSLFLAFGHWEFNLLAVAMLYISFVLDQVDGEVARYHGVPSFNLLYLDEIRHLVIYPIPIFCMSFPAYYDSHLILMFFLGFLAALALILTRLNFKLAPLIYMQRAILQSHFKEMDLIAYLSNLTASGLSSSSSAGANVQQNGVIFWSAKRVLSIVYGMHTFITDQVGLLICLFTVTILDVFLPKFYEFSYQTYFFIMFAILGPVLYLKTVFGWFKDGTIERQCVTLNEISLKRFDCEEF